MELSIGYENWVNSKHSKGEKVVQHGKSQEQLQAMVNRTKEINEGRKRGS
jgi:hypothetical protein